MRYPMAMIALALFAASLSLLFSGGGRLSVDRTLTGER